MTLAVGTELGVGALPDDVWSDLRRILRGDTVSSGTVAATFTLVRYSRTVDSGPAHRIDDLANVYSDQATIHGVGSSFLLPGGEPITNYAGITLQFSDGSVATIYDVEECNGDGYCVRDSNGDWIKAPTFVNLFHELAHAYHFVSGTMPASAPDQEFQAETEENWVRGAEDLPLRDPTNHALKFLI